MAFNLAEDGSYGGAVLRRVAGAGVFGGKRGAGQVQQSSPLRGAKRRSNPDFLAAHDGLLRCARIDGSSIAHPISINKHDFTISRPDLPEACYRISLPSSRRVQGMPGARCTRGLVCNRRKKHAHEHTGSAEASDIPCAMALRLISRSPRRAGLVVTVISGIASTNLTPASGRQDHATLPYASVPHVKGTSASTASHPALVTIAKRPSYRDGTKSIYC